jgi:diguanylate cyclase (GGDEF)-like protein
MAITDKLTGLGNRQLFDLALEQAIRMQRRAARPFSIIIFDIDHFKNVNDTRGHLVGDEVIKKLVEAAKRQIRNSDVFCRWGGEEFIVLANDCPELQAMDVAEKLRSSIAMEALVEPDDGLRATVSVGVTTYQSYDDMNSILRRADAALYLAKDDGRNCVKAV